jgi:hypothetical protein
MADNVIGLPNCFKNFGKLYENCLNKLYKCFSRKNKGFKKIEEFEDDDVK